MAYRFREQYQAVLLKREALREAGAFSDPDEEGSKVAILVPFMAELLMNHELDSRENFEGQTERVAEYYQARGREPQPIMDAKVPDFERVLADKSIPTVVVAGFGNFSAVAVQLPAASEKPFRFGYLDWLHMADMATHLKLGKFVTLQCGGFFRQFNPPLASGVVSTHRDMLAVIGKGRYASDDWERDIEPVTTKDVLGYDEIKEKYQLHRGHTLAIPDAAYIALRGMRERRQNPEYPWPDPIPHTGNMRQFLTNS